MEGFCRVVEEIVGMFIIPDIGIRVACKNFLSSLHLLFHESFAVGIYSLHL